jgi:glycosyltransferase involved in cell wall biosynthesis
MAILSVRSCGNGQFKTPDQGSFMGLNILVVNWQDKLNPLSGGAEVHLHEIFERIARWGHHVTLLCSTFDGAPGEEERDGIRIIRRGGRMTFNYIVPSAVLKDLAGERFDILVEDLNKVPFRSPSFASCPVLIMVHHLFGTTIFREVTFPLALYIYLWERAIPFLYRGVPFTVVSESTRQDLVARGIDASLVHVVHNGMNLDLYRPASGPKESRLVLYLGRIKRYKRVDLALRAMVLVLQALPDARLVVVGGGSNLPELRELTSRLGIDERVTFTGHVSTQEKVRWLQRATVLVNPSPKEGWGLTNMEASACGTPVVASDSPGLRDSVIDGETGYLVPHGDVEKMAGALVRVLTDEKIRSQLSAASITWAARFRWEEAARTTLELIEQVISRGSYTH